VNDPATLAFADLQPEDILATLSDLGFACDGRFLALNSYENRVPDDGATMPFSRNTHLPRHSLRRRSRLSRRWNTSAKRCTTQVTIA
jgi:hypothetical protein